MGVGEGLGVGCGLGALLGPAASWLALLPLVRNWGDCDAEPGQTFLLVLLGPAVVVGHFAAFVLSYALLRRRAELQPALALAVLAVVIGQVLLAVHGLSGELCTEPF